LVLLLAMTPVVAVYTYWSAQWSSRNYIADLKRETKATTRALAPIVSGYIDRGQWTQVHDVLQRMSADGTEGAVLHNDGRLWYAVSDLPRELILTATRGTVNPLGFDFEQSVRDRYWFCRIVPLNGRKLIGYLLVAQDWTDIDEDVRQRMLPPVGAALLVTALVAALIPILVNRYVSRPLAELSRRVLRFSGTEQPGKSFANNEVDLISEEFQRLDQRLTKAHQDLVERHRYELELDRRLQRSDRLATIGTLASGLAHEIGTPMAVIRTRTELLLDSNASHEKAREGLEIILNQIQRISRIVQMLLDYARSREPVRAKHDIKSIIEHVVKLMETEAKRRGVRIVIELDNRPLTVECDAEQLQQVFINLAINAFDAMAANGGILRVRAELEPSDNDHPSIAKLTFEDNGSGVPPQFQEHLFDPFFTTKPPGKGTGMGLSVSQAIIHDHNGEINFDSQPSGTRFYVRIPMAVDNNAPHIEGDERMERTI
jgi:two-component system, NtrC family, sensor kinase